MFDSYFSDLRETVAFYTSFEAWVIIPLVAPFVAFFFYRRLVARKNYDQNFFKAYPITTIATIESNCSTYGVSRFYIGKVNDMKKFAGWNAVTPQINLALHVDGAYDPELMIDGALAYVFPNHALVRNQAHTLFLGAWRVLVVRYKDGRHQLAQLAPTSNDTHEAIQLIKRHASHEVPISGEFEALKHTPAQSTNEPWYIMFLIIMFVILLFIVVGVFVVACIDFPDSQACLW